jgi:hypothetical protein
MTGIAPGQRITLDWRRLEFYTENELVFNTRPSEHFFYSWSELTISATDWLRIGLAGQRARIVQTDRDFDRGLLLGFNYKRVGFTAYALNPDEQQAVYIFSANVEL